MSREPDGWIDLSDFKAGIVHDLGQTFLGGSPVGRAAGPDGSASIENTYRCITLAGGGLGPLPAQDWTYSRPTIAADVATWAVQLYVIGAMEAPGAGATVIPDPRSLAVKHPCVFMLAFDGMASTTRRYRVYADRVWQAGQTLAAGNVDLIVTTDIGAAGAAASRGLTSFAGHYLNYGGNAGSTVLFSYSNPAGTVVSVRAWPDPAAPTTLVPVTVNPTFTPAGAMVFSHQGRACFFAYNGESWGPASTRLWDDYLYFTTPGTVTADGGANIVTQDSTTGIGCAASISASDLLAITHSMGAALIQGDLANPTVRRMPAVVGTNGSKCFGVSTPAGFVYGVNRGGIYAWTGETSTLLSPQLPDDAWIVPAAAAIVPYQGRFALWQNWVMCPGNWVYDLDTASWWRIEDPATFLAYEWMTNPINGYCYGNAPLWTDSGAQMSGYLRGYDRAVGAVSWSWQSQPLTRTRNRIVEVRDVDLDCQGSGTIAVTFTAIDGTTQTVTYTLSGSTTLSQRIRQTFSVAGSDVKVRLLATGAGGISTAPVVYGLHIGYTERRHVGAG